MPGLEDTGAACAVCGAALAPDQRYCVECGERRGRSDLPFAPVAVEYEEETVAAPAPARRLLSANSALIGGIGVLLLALGVGVLIGRDASTASASKSAPPVQVVTIAGGAAAPAAAAGGAATAPTTGAAATPGAPAGAGAASGGSTAAKASKAPAAHATVTQSSSSSTVTAVEHTRPLTGPNRPGYKNGKFTGNFFGP